MTDGTRMMGNRAFAAVAEVLGIESEFVPFAAPIGDDAGAVTVAAIERLAVRYSISRTRSRTIALFDIVGFSLLSQVEQVAQLNSLEVSINVALRCMHQAGLNINLGRSTTGDGYYIWNRGKGPEDDIKLSFLMMLVLADNAISRGVVGPRMVPRLRTCLTIGSHFSYYQVKGLQRSDTEYIVGDATIELARLVDQTMPDQILVGEFYRPLESGGEPLDSLGFMGAV
jgi:class 3 adenylate cyclase